MASRLSWLGSCTNAQLGILARAVGVNSSGTKPVLTSHLLDYLPKGTFGPRNPRDALQEPCRILSIDMGIRNLAYCCLILPDTHRRIATDIGNPVVQDWARIAISEDSTKSKQAKYRTPKEASGKVERSGKVTLSKPKEAFDPATYSQHAYDLVTTLLKDLKPTHILIERQRFRSMGGSAVQEWTLRVNMFEAMIYAILKTFSESGFWKGIVHPIAPSKVSNFWIANKHGALQEGPASKSAKTKTAKIDLVAEWLENGGRFELKGAAVQLGKAYLTKKTRKDSKSPVKQKKLQGSQGRAGAQDSVEKLDDLADCLLQGMAWIKWEKNRRWIMAKGAEALHELEEHRHEEIM
ncbi:MAG: hypothetical protein ALECFALPRED_001170 [Alectoria fallacina]|uniref:Mitochondrial resolvase Ydc2 catalytic domain-containing protein n=1 Tax=Alectoria fallacina TaxID=1903189 RepID=A0A8H3FCF3_9LECA|nr:MAG: hypothetical protein ALECFALPRED_001170 [Alectoria fallacina]